MIPKILHFIWVGDETKRPNNCIQTWIDHNPGYEVKIWGNASLADQTWLNAAHMAAMYKRELNGVADMMRWEILYNEGGIVLDADSICLLPLDNAMLSREAFACWESEMARPGMIAAGYFGCCAGNLFVHQIMVDINKEPSVTHDRAWKTVGPQRLTDSYRRYQYFALHIFPSYYFIPEHFSGLVYKGPGPIYANQIWASTKNKYDELYLQQLDVTLEVVEHAAPAATIDTTEPNASQPPLPFGSGHDPYFVQRVKISPDVMHHSRVDVFKKLCTGQRVLHIGCADWPIENPQTSLHLALEPVCAKLDGFDIHAEALAALAPYTKGQLYSQFEDLTAEYDLILVPEVMEHVSDVATFLVQLQSLNASSFAITVPDAYQCHRRHFEYQKYSETFTEIVHPDHNCWYTPYTFTNVIKKFTPWNIEGMWFFNSISLLMLAAKPQAS